MNGSVDGSVRTLIRLEALLLLISATGFYALSSFSWKLFAILFFVPDIAFIGYLLGAKIGAFTYNLTHSLIGPLILLFAYFILENPAFMPLATIWFAHIGFDRALGYGLKYSAGFKFTHLGVLGSKHRKE